MDVLCISQFQLLRSPQTTPRDLHILLAHCPQGFTYTFMLEGPGVRRGQIFPEMNENLLNISILRVWFQEAIQNRRKTHVFVYANCFFAHEFLPQGLGFCSLSLPEEWGFRPLKNSPFLPEEWGFRPLKNSPGVSPGVS